MDTTVCDGNTVNISCGYINNHLGEKPYWKIIKRDSNGDINIIIGPALAFTYNDGLMWIHDKNNTENSRLLVGPVDETFNQSLYQCYFQTSPTIYSSVGTLTIAGEIFYYVCICVFIV